MEISILSIVLTLLLFTLIISHTFHNWIVVTKNNENKSGIVVSYFVVLFIILIKTCLLFK